MSQPRMSLGDVIGMLVVVMVVISTMRYMSAPPWAWVQTSALISVFWQRRCRR